MSFTDDKKTETIAAISSGMTKSGIGIIRVSGPESRAVVEKIFRSKSGKEIKLTKPSHIYYGYIGSVSRETYDEVLVLNMPAPHSFTGEDVVEIDCHGGILVMRRALEAVIEAGARNAEPGEFTKRAFLNGRIDLSQAEAIIDLINAENDNAIRNSFEQLRGSLSSEIVKLRSDILERSAYIEAALDDPEHYSLDGYAEVIREAAYGWKDELTGLIDSFDRGRIIGNGIKTAIIGKPNAGKSSLMNAILGKERAIVTMIPGTTRDTISENISFGNINLRLTDTAGIRESDDVIEQMGVDKALENAEDADLILYVIDGTAEFDEEERKIAEMVLSKKAHTICVINKTDAADEKNIEDIIAGLMQVNVNADTVVISAKEGIGINEMYKKIEAAFDMGEISENEGVIVSSVRHLELLKNTRSSIEALIVSAESGMPEDFYTVDMMDAYHALGQIIGEETEEDLINEIFSKFCMGK
ncbi:MAG: tRNA uridine-5-carboxymethylaminomethyl(34) synthesis GTPase MnmE [Eubacteriales bacterium]|nr:tRNA uridine-5-carboxymethylaminomethyl(34) synthesis GTPase MnmE [Eubacteriales bacterium]